VVLNLGLRHRGTTFSSFETPSGEPGGNQVFLKAYGRAGIACPRCGVPLQRIVVAGRGTTFCTKCQPATTSPVAPGPGNS
jgi:formamidopyrimidine-DNA glycosylase